MPKPLPPISSGQLLGGTVVKRIDATLDIDAATVSVTGFRDPTGLMPMVELAGTSAELAMKVRLGMALAGGHIRRVEQVQAATWDMLAFVMDEVAPDGKAIAGPDGEPVLSTNFIEAFLHLKETLQGPAEEDEADAAEGEDAAPPD